MNLVKDFWSQNDIEEFKRYLCEFSKGKEKGKWEQRIINTKLPCIAVPSDIVKKISREIYKGNYVSFIDYWPWDNATLTFIVGELISRIKDINVQKEYLIKYSSIADNWATIDTIKPKVTDKNRYEYVKFAQACVKNTHIFTRRLGLILCLKCIAADCIQDILDIVRNMYNEQEYYVNMAAAWLVAESFYKFREETLELFKAGVLNKFVNNKAISKCRDSFRVSNEDKQMLLKYRQK